MRRLLPALFPVLLLVVVAACGGGGPDRDELILATTTSTMDSGLLDVLIPAFEEESGYRVTPVAVGSGQALELGRRGEADVLLVHAPEAEERFMAEGHGVDRRLVMHNDFVIVGPPEDPAGARAAAATREVLSRIAAAGARFISRGDDSGTHQLERALWQAAGIDPEGEAWYVVSGQGMGATLGVANERRGYTLTDRATYLALRDRLDLEILHQGDPVLRNVYHVIQVDPSKNDRVNAEGAQAFAEFLVGERAQEIIGEFGRDRFGEPLFTPDAGKDEADLR
ncbi:MAG TPA: substrate-binding domain-containing protein [Dehalococcoidia bacterium]